MTPTAACYFQPAQALSADAPPARCFGELWSYGQAGVDAALRDWANGSLEYKLLNGRFLLVFWDNQRQEWTLVTDRLGTYHVYAVWHGDKIAAIGCDLLELARKDSLRQLDWEGLATFFAFGFFLDDRTCYQDIRILQPASVYRIGADGTLRSHQRYWHWQHEVDKQRTYEQTIEQYDVLLKQAVSRCLSGRIVLPLSGGLDSRSLAYAIPRGKAVQSYSYGYTASSIETRIASQIAKKQDFSFCSHIIEPYLFSRLPEITAALHGSQDVTQARQVSVNAWVAGEADAVLTGLWGDVWCDQMGAADGLPDGMSIADLVVGRFQKRGREWLMEHVVTPHFAQTNLPAYLEARVRTGITPFDSIEDPDFRIKAYKTSQWAFRWSNTSLRGFALGAVPRVPYYDVDIVDFFLTVPTDFVRDRRLQIDHLKRFAPKLAAIRWQQAGVNLNLVPYARWASLPSRVSGKLRRTLARERTIERNWEVQFLSPHGRQELEGYLLQDGRELHQLVSPTQINRLIEAFYADPNAANGYTVSMLLTFAAWLELMA